MLASKSSTLVVDDCCCGAGVVAAFIELEMFSHLVLFLDTDFLPLMLLLVTLGPGGPG